MEQAWTVIVFRLVVAFILSFAIGIERQISRKPVGFGTYALVCTGSCLFVLVHIQTKFGGVDLNLAGGLAAGVGFLGSGVLMQRGSSVQGFTTASTIWLMAAMGAAVGAGMYQTAVASFAMILFVLMLDKVLENLGIGGYTRQMRIVLASEDQVDDAMKVLAAYKAQMSQFQWDAEKGALTLTVRVNVPASKTAEALEKLRGVQGLREAIYE